MAIPEWMRKAEEKRVEVATNIPSEWRLPQTILDNIADGSIDNVLDVPRRCAILSEAEISLTEDYDASELVSKLAASQISSYELTLAFCKRAAIAQQVTSCLTEIFFDTALERARQFDEHLAKTGKVVGPLHGLPVSVKESFNIAGVHSTIGFVSFIDNPAARENSALIDILLAAGAVLYVKTNIPQTMMTPDSHNNIFGRVLNPHKLSLTAGGSSGGEGALVAMKGSPLGIGTDIAGSIRIPALCNGIFGFKPSVGRLPYRGQCSGGRKGMAGVAPSAGPLTRSARDAELLLRTVFNSDCTALDELALAVPWIEPQKKSQLTFGIMPEDPDFPLHPPMRRTLNEAVQKLKNAGHVCVELYQFPSISSASKMTFKYFNMDPERTVFKNIDASGEPIVPSVEVSYPICGGEHRPSLEEFFDLNVERAKVLSSMREIFTQNKLDAIIGPGYHAGCSVPHDTFGQPVYTVLFNLVDVSTKSDSSGHVTDFVVVSCLCATIQPGFTAARSAILERSRVHSTLLVSCSSSVEIFTTD